MALSLAARRGGALRAFACCESAPRPRFHSGSSTFGCREGAPITNKASILGDVDAALGVDRPPDLEVLLADHLTSVADPLSEAMHTCFLRFGHVAVRYTTSDGTQRVMNILGGVDGADLVHFVDPADYLYGTRGWDTYAQQGGASRPPRPRARRASEKTPPKI